VLLALAALGVFALQAAAAPNRPGRCGCSSRPVAAPLFILAAWYLDAVALNPQDVAGAQAAGMLLGFGLLLLLAPFPCTAVPTGARTAPPPAFLLVMLLNDSRCSTSQASRHGIIPDPPPTDWSLWIGLLGL